MVRARGSQMRLKLAIRQCDRQLHGRGKGAGFSDEIETVQPAGGTETGQYVVRARGSQMRLKHHSCDFGQLHLYCGKGAGFSDEIETFPSGSIDPKLSMW